MLLTWQFWLSGDFTLSTQLQVVFSDGIGIGNFVIVELIVFHIWHAVTAYLYSIPVKYFVELFVMWEMLIS